MNWNVSWGHAAQVVGKRKSGATDDFLALLVGDVLLFCLPHSCRKSPSGLRSPEKFCNYDDELSQHAFKCTYLSPVLSYSDLPILFSLCVCYLFFCVHRFCCFSIMIGCTKTACALGPFWPRLSAHQVLLCWRGRCRSQAEASRLLSGWWASFKLSFSSASGVPPWYPNKLCTCLVLVLFAMMLI